MIPEGIADIYCGACGKKLKPYVKVVGYSFKTGEPIEEIWATCPHFLHLISFKYIYDRYMNRWDEEI